MTEHEYDAMVPEERLATITRLERELAEARQDLETERLRLAACGVAAIGNTPAMVADRLAPEHPYYSASYGDVCRAVDREMAHRAEVEAAARWFYDRGWLDKLFDIGDFPAAWSRYLKERREYATQHDDAMGLIDALKEERDSAQLTLARVRLERNKQRDDAARLQSALAAARAEVEAAARWFYHCGTGRPRSFALSEDIFAATWSRYQQERREP
jgi:uncharacterized protein YigA (DUF484 family)